MEILRKYKKENFPDAPPQDWVLPGRRGRPMDMRWFMKQYIRPLAQKLGIPKITWHALRHMNNSMMADEGVDVKTRMDRMGHVSEYTNMIYSHVADTTNRAASELLMQKFKLADQPQQETQPASLKVTTGNRMETSDELSY